MQRATSERQCARKLKIYLVQVAAMAPWARRISGRGGISRADGTAGGERCNRYAALSGWTDGSERTWRCRVTRGDRGCRGGGPGSSARARGGDALV
jgi:hypothetical protein